MPQYLILTADPTHRNAFRDELRYSPPAKSQTQVVSKQNAPGPLQNTWLQKKKNDNNLTDCTVSAENEFILSQQGLRRNESIRGELNWVMICISWEKGDKQDCLRIEFSIPRYLKFLEAKYRDIHSLKWN